MNPFTVPVPDYPRPQMVRTSPAARGLAPASYKTLRDTGDKNNWQNLNGLWEWERAADHIDGVVPTPPFGRTLNDSILVPFPWESCLSGVVAEADCNLQPQTMWYRLTFTLDDNANVAGRTILHFGAVDWQSTFFLNKKRIASHSGGYDSIDLDITDALDDASGQSSSVHELLVYAYDPSNRGYQPNGKQNYWSKCGPGGGAVYIEQWDLADSLA